MTTRARRTPDGWPSSAPASPGSTAAYVAARGRRHVTLFEADDRLGGHADTHRVADLDGELAIDTGFIVHNERTYPTLLRLFAELGVATQDVGDVAVGRATTSTGLEWAGALGRARAVPDLAPPRRPGVPADAHRDPPLPPPRHGRCSARADRAERRADAARVPARRPLLGVLRAPLHGARWWRPCGRATPTSRSTTPPATCSRSWSTTACSASSARRVAHGHRWLARRTSPRSRPRLPDVRTGTKVTSVLETADGRRGHRRQRRRSTTYDAVVVATHPDQALAMLAEPTARAARGAVGACRTRRTPRCSTPTPRCCRDARARPGVVELPRRRRDGTASRHGHLRPDPAAAARRPTPTTWSPSAARTSSTRPP